MADGSATPRLLDALIVGAGFSGMYQLHLLRDRLGLSVKALEAGGGVGGTWYWNRYPGARCDIQTIDYSYTFDPELENAWKWSEKYATQPEILRYLGFVADRYDLRRDIRFNTKVISATWDESTQRWQLTTSNGAGVSCRYYIMATGCLSTPKPPEIESDPASPLSTSLARPPTIVSLPAPPLIVAGTLSWALSASVSAPPRPLITSPVTWSATNRRKLKLSWISSRPLLPNATRVYRCATIPASPICRRR